jgi:hypothetical protein
VQLNVKLNQNSFQAVLEYLFTSALPPHKLNVKRFVDLCTDIDPICVSAYNKATNYNSVRTELNPALPSRRTVLA